VEENAESNSSKIVNQRLLRTSFALSTGTPVVFRPLATAVGKLVASTAAILAFHAKSQSSDVACVIREGIEQIHTEEGCRDSTLEMK
jgi:hypothetical protein